MSEIRKLKEKLEPRTPKRVIEDDHGLSTEVYSVALPRKASPRRVQKTIQQEGIFDLVALKSLAANSSSESLEIDATNSSNILEEILESRIVLQPHETRTFKINFSPKSPEHFEAEYALGILNSRQPFHSIKAKGSGVIPRIDMTPSRIFKKVKRSKKNELGDPAFFEDVQTFDFGCLLWTGKDDKVHRKKASFKFWNDSKISLELEASLMISDPKTFDVEPKQLFIEPGEFGTVDVTAGVTKLGPNENRLFLLVKNNPRVEAIELRSNGTKLDVKVEEKNLAFGRALMYRAASKIFKIRNDSTVPIFWKILALVPVENRIKFAPSLGWTKPRAETDVIFTFLANQIGVMDKITLNFGVFLHEMDELREALLTETITVTGETYDVAVDVNFANPIDMGIVKVDSIVSRSFELRNRGQYDVKFVIELEEGEKFTNELSRDVRKNITEDFKVSPATGNLVPAKTTTINVTFDVKFEMDLQLFPALRCNLIDANNGATIIAEFPLTLSITSNYARFQLIPDSEINFGPITIFGKKTLQFSVENTGKFPLSYRIKTANSLDLASENLSGNQREKSSRAESTKRGTGKSHDRSSHLRLGPFTLSDIEGRVEVGELRTMTIECHPELEGFLQEKIVVFVDNCLPQDKLGKSLALKVASCVPSIDFGDFDAIFAESYLVDDLQDFHSPNEIDTYTVFSRNEKCLYFERVNIHKTYTTSIKLHNRGLVPARVTVFLRPDGFTPKNAEPDTFAVDTVQETISPMSSRIFSVSFTPSLIETYTGVLEAAVELPEHLKTDSSQLSIKLCGESCVPEVIMTEPAFDNRTRKSKIHFGRCLVDEKTWRTLSFKNIGKISAKIIVGIHDDDEMIYAVRNSKNIPDAFQGIGDPGEDHRSIICALRSDERVELLVDFRPKNVGPKRAKIQFHVMDNPYEDLTLELEGEGFMENVVLEGLPIVEISKPDAPRAGNRSKKSLKNRGMLSRGGSTVTLGSQTLVSSALVYNLDYKTCFVNKMSKMNFAVVNKSGEQYFRFEFSSHPNIVFVPSIGHLHRLEKKEVTAHFLTTEPITYKETPLECAINEIRFSMDQREPNSWDDRRTSVEWLDVDNEEEGLEEMLEARTQQKVVVPTREPSHEILPGSWRTIQLVFSATAAYSEFVCDVEAINFMDTLMFQNREHTFTMENPGNVDLKFQWKVDMDAGYPARLPEISTRQPSSRSRKSNDSRPSSRSSGGILYPENKKTPLEQSKKSYVIDVEPYDSRSRTQDLFSDSIARTQRSMASWTENGDDQPFCIKPDVGSIPARESIEFAVRFSPLDVFDYKAFLICQIENLNPNLERPKILATGRSLLPYCHFDVEESDYLTSGRRKQNLPSLVELGGGDANELIEDFSNPRVVEFRAVGTGQSHAREFHLINPTSENYRFTWKDLSARGPEQLPYFQCAREEDLAESGKRSRVKFSFFAEEIGTFEAFWRFSIDRYSLQTLFLLVANVAEPSVRFSETRVRMKPTIVGMRVDDVLTIANDENAPFSWKIPASGLHSEGGALQKLLVSPMSGILGARTKEIVQISLQPNCVGEFAFPLQCQVKGMKNPLSILVTARVSQISPRVVYSLDDKGQRTFEARSDRDNVLDFGKLTLNKASAMKFQISNASDVTFRYTWSLDHSDPKYSDTKNRAYFIKVSKESDHVSNVYASTCHLELVALKKTIVRQHPVTLKIDNGPIYRMLLKASSKTPSIEFSFHQFDFGACYVRAESSPAYVTQLLLRNNDRTPVIVECSFENLPHLMLDLRSIAQAIPANSTVAISVHFRPAELRNYHENISFNINDSTAQEIGIKGEGIFYKLSLEEIRDKFIEFGNVQVGKTATRNIRVKNSGRAPIEVKFDFIKKLSPRDESDGEKKWSQEGPTIGSKAKRLSSKPQEFREVGETSGEKGDSILEMSSIEPSRKVPLAAGKSLEIVVKFVPTKRINNFVEKIGAEADSTILPLFFVRGSSVAREFRLDQSDFYFGTIVEGSSKTLKVVLHNDGDFGAKFKWNVSQLPPHFSLEPTAGYCPSGMDNTFDLIFQPKKLSPMLEAKASIEIEKYPSLRIKCSGACCKIPKAIDLVKFSAPVRSTQTKNLTITNDTDVGWSVETLLNGEYFEAEKSFVVPSKSSYACTLTYSPLVMNTNKNPHEGRIIFKLPEERPPLVYALHGSSSPPQAEAKISRQLPAKTKYAELLPVKNWLNKSQSFHCGIELMKDSKFGRKVLDVLYPKNDAAHYSFTGNLRMDLPANGTRDYRAMFHCYNETTLNFRVTFTNDDGEYEFYEIQYKITKPDILSTIKLTTPARTTTSYYLAIENPLNDQRVSFTATCQNRDITIRNVPKVVAAKSNDKILIEYSPLMPGEGVAKLDVNSSELGNFPYELKLKATVPPPEKVIHVTAMLGSSTNFPITINNISKKNAEFKITVDDVSFTCKESISAAPQKNAILEVTYEPCDARNVNATLRATSESLGEICFPLIGSYTLPKPQGPFAISRNSSIDILFRNVSDKTKTFTYVIEGSDEFTIAAASNSIKPKEVSATFVPRNLEKNDDEITLNRIFQTTVITVKFNGPNDFLEEKKYPTTGKLVVSSVEPFSSPISWVYYLRGSE
ncbi:hydrocephalus-inducing protein homolog [Venturia canescens]|uniref:hydrocephalus-inducing protein homolog n=1 Tax=Venturia canescens TaxID=32260 RepID=UPI001C9D5A45|nr:hydrocephalus-inducing protein homolog [Venturia canescens]